MRYCSPTNRASQLSPETFSTYLREPWYQILTEWDEIELQDEDDGGEGGEVRTEGNVAEVDVLVRREGEESWTIVNWQLSRYNGRWLTDSMSIN